MTALNFQDAQMAPAYTAKSLQSPAGWVTTGIHVINLNAKSGDEDEGMTLYDLNLPKAAKLTEQLIDALQEGLSIDVPVSYMRVERNTAFHILLLIKDYDFHSPKIVSARILAEKFARTGGFNIKFVFAIESENRMSNTMTFGGYKLMHKINSELNIEKAH